jgi:hypothetical protein
MISDFLIALYLLYCFLYSDIIELMKEMRKNWILVDPNLFCCDDAIYYFNIFMKYEFFKFNWRIESLMSLVLSIIIIELYLFLKESNDKIKEWSSAS